MAAQISTEADRKQMLAQAIQQAQGGNLAGARQTAEHALAQIAGKPESAQFHAFLGMVTARLGDLSGATEHLEAARTQRPQDITIACNLIAILMDQGREAEALKLATPELARTDASMRVARYRAFLAQNAEQFADAAEAYELVLQSTPQDFECWNNLGNARAGMGDFSGAVDALERAMSLNPRSAPTQINLATALREIERDEEAEKMLLEASGTFPADAQPPYQLYILYKLQMRQDEAVAQLEEAIRREPASAARQLELGIEYGVQRRTDEAEQAYRRAIAIEPDLLDAYLGLAIQYEHTNREDMFAPLIEEARGKGIADDSLAFIEALELRRQKLFDEALAKIESVSTDIEEVRTAHIRATLLDRLGRTDAAFDAYARANELMIGAPSEPLKRAEELRKKLEAEIALLSPEWRDSWTDIAIDDARPDPVFLVGFPRSGTTLLDTFLMGHKDTVVMEEQPPLNIVDDLLGGSAALPQLSASQVQDARDRYFEEVAKIQPLDHGKMLVDKSPLFLYRLPLIRRLFPKAKIILALRHPCDVVLSCFMSNFRPNPAMANFLRLEDAAQFYDLTFTHWQKSRALFEPQVHEIRYESLVEDVAAEVRPLIEWLGLEWDENLLDHTATAKSRGLITTASYSQVTEPIYKRASGRWLRYRDHLDPIIAPLSGWADHLGYSFD